MSLRVILRYASFSANDILQILSNLQRWKCRNLCGMGFVAAFKRIKIILTRAKKILKGFKGVEN